MLLPFENIEKYVCWSLWFLWTECFHFVRSFLKFKNFQHVFVFQMFFHCLFITFLIFQTCFLFLFPSDKLLVKSYVNCFWVFFIFLNCLNCLLFFFRSFDSPFWNFRYQFDLCLFSTFFESSLSICFFHFLKLLGTFLSCFNNFNFFSVS